jgi:ribonuclease PH
VFDLEALERTSTSTATSRPTAARAASITGAFVAAHDAVSKLIAAGKLARSPIRDSSPRSRSASTKRARARPRLRGRLALRHRHERRDDRRGGFVEVQGTAEGAPFSRAELNALLDLAQAGIGRLVQLQKDALGADHV